MQPQAYMHENATVPARTAGTSPQDERMNTLSESELSDFVKNGVVKRLNILQSEAGKYQLNVNLTWKEGDWTLLTTRKTVREWASLDRLARHIRDNYGNLPAISLRLYQPGNSAK